MRTMPLVFALLAMPALLGSASAAPPGRQSAPLRDVPGSPTVGAPIHIVVVTGEAGMPAARIPLPPRPPISRRLPVRVQTVPLDYKTLVFSLTKTPRLSVPPSALNSLLNSLPPAVQQLDIARPVGYDFQIAFLRGVDVQFDNIGIFNPSPGAGANYNPPHAALSGGQSTLGIVPTGSHGAASGHYLVDVSVAAWGSIDVSYNGVPVETVTPQGGHVVIYIVPAPCPQGCTYPNQIVLTSSQDWFFQSAFVTKLPM